MCALKTSSRGASNSLVMSSSCLPGSAVILVLFIFFHNDARVDKTLHQSTWEKVRLIIMGTRNQLIKQDLYERFEYIDNEVQKRRLER